MSGYRVGARVRVRSTFLVDQVFRGLMGTIIEVRQAGYWAVRLDYPPYDYTSTWTFSEAFGIELLNLAPEEEAQIADQKRRQEHADRYL